MSKKPERLGKLRMTSSGGGYAPIDTSFQSTSKQSKSQREVCQDVDDAPSLDYEYCFEIAGGEVAFQQHVGCAFVIKPTKAEGRLARWEKIESGRVVRYRILASKNEPKELVVSVAERSMGISPSAPIRLSPKDTTCDVLDAYVPLYPCLEIDGQRWLPTEGYFYHFHRTALVQEYCIEGGGKWAFWATESDNRHLSDHRLINRDQSAMLIWWKKEGQIVDSQYLVYLETPLMPDEFDEIDEEWLACYGTKIDIPELVETAKKEYKPPKPSTIESDTNSGLEAKTEKIHHVQFNPDTQQCETWSEIAAQYGMAPKALLTLNPRFDADPLSLDVGDELVVALGN